MLEPNKNLNTTIQKEFINYRGYLKSDAKEVIEKIDNEYLFIVKGQHLFKKTTLIDSYDKKGNFLGYFEKTSFFKKRITKTISNEYKIVQLNYDFFLLPIGHSSNIEEVYNTERLLVDSFNVKPLELPLTCNNLDELVSLFYGKATYYKSEEPFRGYEICYTGFSKPITNYTNKKIINLSVKKYIQSKNKALEKYPKHKESIQYLYALNMGLLCKFYGISRKVLERDKFCRNTIIINKIHRKISRL